MHFVAGDRVTDTDPPECLGRVNTPKQMADSAKNALESYRALNCNRRKAKLSLELQNENTVKVL